MQTSLPGDGDETWNSQILSLADRITVPLSLDLDRPRIQTETCQRVAFLRRFALGEFGEDA